MTEDLIWRFFINQPRQVSSKVCRRGRGATLFSSARTARPHHPVRRTSNIKRCAMLMKELFRGRSSVASVAQGGLGPAPRAARPPSALHLAKRAVAHDILYSALTWGILPSLHACARAGACAELRARAGARAELRLRLRSPATASLGRSRADSAPLNYVHAAWSLHAHAAGEGAGATPALA